MVYQTLPLDVAGVEVVVKRIDLVHPTISGNKFYKLKYNLIAAREQGKTQLISFGGAYSNHIHALAHAAQAYGFRALGIIRGDELAQAPLNPTLQDAVAAGMELAFISRHDYRLKHTPEFLQHWLQRYPDAYILPEGGTNALAVRGCEDILAEEDCRNFDVVCCAVGTGGTLAGIINASGDAQQVWGFAALNSTHLSEEVAKWTQKRNWQVFADDVFGGYGRFNAELLDFIVQQHHAYQLPLEPIYTGKAWFRLQQSVHTGRIARGSRVLFVHTGGLQGYRHQFSNTETSA